MGAPLTIVPKEDPNVDLKEMEDETAAEIKATKKELKKQFKNLQKGMGDKKTSKPDKFIEAFLNFGMENKDLRDELYFMVIKQLTENPSPDSVGNGYDILAMMLSAFLPSEGFL